MWYYALLAFYLTVVTLTCFYAFRFGQQPEHYGALIVGTASALTVIFSLSLGNHFHSVEPAVFVIDMLAWVALLRLALTSNRYWPLWATAFHSIAIITHLAVFLDTSIVPEAYATGQGFWAYPVLAALLLGSERCRRARMGIRAA